MYLGMDCGTQGTKALVVDADGRAISRGYAKHALIERASGAREQDPAWWVEALRAAVRQAVEPAGAGVLAMGVSGQQHGLVVLDESRKVIRPAKLWNDTETAGANRDLLRLMGGRAAWSERFGIVPLTGYTVSKLLWLREAEPENFARVRHILLPHEYLNFWLTGELRAEAGDASGTAFFDVRSRTWIREVLDAIDGGTGQLFGALPELRGVEEIVGTLRPVVAAELGLPRTCVVSSGGGDNMMGAIGTGNVTEGVVTMSLGTSSTVYSFRGAPVLDPTGNVAPFCSSSGGWLPLVCTMNATNVVTQTLAVLGKTVVEIDAALAATEPGAGGLVFVPFLNGERTPDLPEARGSIVGVSTNNFTAAHLIRAVVEGVSFGILNGLDLILQGEAAERIVLIGGGARSLGWAHLLADATGALIQIPEEDEAGCLGAAMQAAFAYGQKPGQHVTFAQLAERWVRVREERSARPDPSRRIAYNAARATYREWLHRLYPDAVVAPDSLPLAP